MKFIYLLTITFLFALTSVSMAADFTNLSGVTEVELAESNTVDLNDLTMVVTDSGMSFTYGSLSESSFQHAAGFVVVTPVTGDNNQVRVDFDINILFVSGETINIDITEGNLDIPSVELSGTKF